MAKKKKFTRGIDALFSDSETDNCVSELEREQENIRKPKKSSSKKKFLEKHSFNIERELSEKLKAYSHEKRLSLTQIIEKSVIRYFDGLPDQEIENALVAWKNSQNDE